MNNLKDIHNCVVHTYAEGLVVLSGFQWTIWRIYTTVVGGGYLDEQLFYQDFNEQFEGYTQLSARSKQIGSSCFIRISMNNLKDIHNPRQAAVMRMPVVLSRFQWTILLQKYKKYMKSANLWENILLFQQKALPLHQQIWRIYTIRIIPLCKHSEWHASVALFLPFSHPCTLLSLSLLSISSLLLFLILWDEIEKNEQA